MLSEQTQQGLGAEEKSASTDSPCHQRGRQGKTNQHFEQIRGGRWGDGDQCSACFIYLYIYLSEKAMAPHSSTVARKIPWMEEPGRQQSMGSLSRTRLSDFTFTFHFHALETEMATLSSVLAWRIPGMGEPGRLQTSSDPYIFLEMWHFPPDFLPEETERFNYSSWSRARK